MAVTNIDSHRWVCLADDTSSGNGVYSWTVERDGVFVGSICTTESPIPTDDQRYYLYDINDTPLRTPTELVNGSTRLAAFRALGNRFDELKERDERQSHFRR